MHGRADFYDKTADLIKSVLVWRNHQATSRVNLLFEVQALVEASIFNTKNLGIKNTATFTNDDVLL